MTRSFSRLGVATLLAAGLFGAACARMSSARMPWNKPQEGPSDENIAAIVLAANNTDISYAKLVPARAQSQAIKDFAARMLTDHNGVNRIITDLMNRINMTPEENTTSLDFRDESTTKRDLMRELEGRAFDSTYIANEITYHTKLLAALDKVLIPNADNPQLKQTLMAIRPAVAAHLDHAQAVRTGLK
jgi:putative membrane protein